MSGLNSGEFGPGSVPAFTAPTLAQAEQYPGFKFTEQAGDQGILAGSAAMGGNISGGTLKSLAGYNTQLANTAYGSLFNEALSAYGAQLQGQQQGFNQLIAPAQIGEAATSTQNQTISQLMQAQGAAGAAGTVGATNAITSGVTSATSSVLQSALLNSLLGPSAGLIGQNQPNLAGVAATPPFVPSSLPAPPPVPTYAPPGGPG